MPSTGSDNLSKDVRTDIRTGLSREEIGRLREQWGYNEIPEKTQPPLKRFAGKFWGLTPWMLEVTIALLWLTGKDLEMYVVAGLLVINALLGFIQEGNANSALHSLKQRLKVSARVMRDGTWSTVLARVLVPGDVVRVRSGDFVPADLRVERGEIDVDQSSLTGESAAVKKKPGDSLFSGSTVRKGESTGVVTATGATTYFGKTVELVRIAKPRLHMEEVTSRVVKWLVAMVGVLILAALVSSAVKGTAMANVLPLAIVLLVSSVPVALPTMFTVSMALGSMELSRKSVLVTRLGASEDAATMKVLCADKTGTMTLNRLSVGDVISGPGHTREEVLLYGALASQEADRDPIDLAFISAFRDSGIPARGLRRVAFVPFDPATRRTQATVEENGRRFLVLKGAVDTIADLASRSGGAEDLLRDRAALLEGKGYRVIAVAKAEEEDNVELVGIAAFHDEPRPDSAELISELEELGISVKMLTGDALSVAREIAGEVGLKGRIIKVSEERDPGEDEQFPQEIDEAAGFAQIYPEDKYAIVRSLQKRGYSVGMTGDGVNDAPALKQAEVGIAVSTATDVAKEAASVVLTSEGMESIVELVKTGRMIYQRIVTWVLNKIVKTFQVVVFVILAYLATGQYVVSVFSMVLFLFLTDFVTLSLSTDNVRYSPKPDAWNVTGLIKVAVPLGLLMIAESFGLLFAGRALLGLGGNIAGLQTFVFDFIVLLSLFNVMIVRERKRFWHSRPSRFLALATGADIGIVLAISVAGIPHLAPISLVQALFALGYAAAVCFLVNDFLKARLVERYA
jgi:H+-transporting ATPase